MNMHLMMVICSEVPISPARIILLIAEITPPELTQSLNVFHIRFQDESGMYGAVIPHSFIWINRLQPMLPIMPCLLMPIGLMQMEVNKRMKWMSIPIRLI
jgi:hypothetical protein